jgi:hypothetical protein
MGRKVRKKSAKVEQLSSRVEKLATVGEVISTDQAVKFTDAELLQFVSAFVDEVSQIPRLESHNLLSAESAREAAKMLDRHYHRLQSFQNRSGLLKRLLEERRGYKDQ